MKKLVEKIDKLIKQQDSFTWENSSKPESHGVYGKKPSGAWNSWVSRIEHVLKESVRQQSEPFIYFETGKAAQIEGNYRDQFDTAKDSYVGALNALKSLVEGEDTFEELLKKSYSTDKTEPEQKAQKNTSKPNEKKYL